LQHFWSLARFRRKQNQIAAPRQAIAPPRWWRLMRVSLKARASTRDGNDRHPIEYSGRDLSNSIQIGGPTRRFLQAADGGLDLVAVTGASIMNPTSNANIAAFVRNGSTIKEPKDFIGQKVGAPGLGAFLHVLLVKWLVEKGVDPKL